MHKNYRRKKPKHHNPGREGTGWRWPSAPAWAKREFWQWYRAREKELFAHDRHDNFNDRVPRSILWDWG